MNNKYKTYRFSGKVALITGSTQGIGLAVAERLALEGAYVVLCSRCQANVDNALKILEISGVPHERMAGLKCHVGNAKDRQNLVDFTLKTFNKIDILVNNVGVNPSIGPILSVTESQFDKIFETNVKANFLLTKLVVPHMEKNGGGAVIFNGSIGAFLIGPEITAYGLSKTALLALVQSLSRELAPKNIRVNSVVPGIVRAGMSRLMWDTHDPNFSKAKNATKGVQSLMGRICEPEEIASAVAYLSSNDASFVTGENHILTGGVGCRL